MIRSAIALWMLCLGIGLISLIVPYYLLIPSLAFIMILTLTIVKIEYGYYLLIATVLVEQINFSVTTGHTEQRFYLHVVVLLPLIIVWALQKVSKTVKARERTPLDVVLLLVVIYEMISLIWTPSFSYGSLTLLVLCLNYLLFYISGAIIRDEEILRKCVTFWIVSGVIASTGVVLTNYWLDVGKVYEFGNYAFQFSLRRLHGRASGLAGCDHVAGFLNMTIAFTIGAMLVTQRQGRRYYLFLLVLYMFYGMILTGSRGAFIGLIGQLIFLLYMYLPFRRKLIRNSVIIAIILLLMVFVAKPGFIDRLLIGFGYHGELLFSEERGLGYSEELGLSAAGLDIRLYWWEKVLKIMIENPIFLITGLGIGGFVYYSQTSPEVNNIAFAFFYEMGIFGIILSIFFFATLVRSLTYYFKTCQNRYLYIMLLASTMALIADPGIHGLIDYDLNSFGSRLFWFPLGFSMAILNLIRKDQRQNIRKD